MPRRTDILMVTHRSAGYLTKSLGRLLESCDSDDRVWLWHNGDDHATLEVLADFLDDPKIQRFHHSTDNVRLIPPMQWLWSQSSARYLAKVDDDCMVDPRWLETLAAAHDDNPSFGVVGSWRPPDEDFRPAVAHRKIEEFNGGHRLLRNHWVQGSGFLLKRTWVERVGTLRQQETFTAYCLRLAREGAVNGWYFPFVPEDHMDDPRSEHTLIRTDQDLLDRLPLSAQYLGVRTVEQWLRQLQRSAEVVQAASLDLRQYHGWRSRLRSLRRRAQRAIGRPAQW